MKPWHVRGSLCLPWLLAACLQACSSIDPDGHAVAQGLAPGVYAVQGSIEAADAGNGGAVGNSGFIATPAGTVVVNTGGSYQLGVELLALAERTTGRRVIAAVITQARPEFLMGTAAFTDRGIEVIAHEGTARLIAQRCHVCLQRLQQKLGDEAMAGTRVLPPTRTIAGSERMAPGGRRIDLLHLGPAQNEGDLVVLDVESGVAFGGALVTGRRIPELDTEGHAAPWRRALAALAGFPLSTLVPSYGAPGEPRSLIAATEGYLAALESEVQAQLDQGAGLQDATRDVTMAGWRHWAQYDALHARNVQLQYVAGEAQQAASATH